MAEVDFGKEKMDEYRGSADRVGGGSPTNGLKATKVDCKGQVVSFAAENAARLRNLELVPPALGRARPDVATVIA